MPLRDAGIRSAEPFDAAGEPGPPPAAGPAPCATGEADDLMAGWRDLGRRLLATHPPASEIAAGPKIVAAGPAPDTVDGPRRPAPARRTADPEPGLVIEHLEVQVVDSAAVVRPPKPRRPATPGTVARPGAWDPAARHYVERW